MIAEREYGFAHKITLDHQRRYNRLIWKLGLWREGEALYERIISQQAQYNIHEKWYVLWAYGTLLRCLGEQQRREKEELVNREFALYRKNIFSGDNVVKLLFDVDQVRRVMRNGSHKEAETLLKSIIERSERVFGKQSLPTLGAQTSYA